MRRVGCERLLAQYVLAGFQAKYGVLVVVGVRSSDVDDVDILVFDQLFVRPVCGSALRNFAILEEPLSSIGGG